jgi:hypothetical protein
MPNTPAIVSIAPLVARLGVCALCSSGPGSLHNTVLIRHVNGATLDFVACDRCAAAMRRIIAAAGGATAAGPAQVVLEGEVPPLVAPAENVSGDTVGEPAVIHEFLDPFVAEEGIAYLVRVWGQARADGTWIGWLTFESADDRQIQRTDRETTQSSREHLAYWATGLQLSYLEGAFKRAS